VSLMVTWWLGAALITGLRGGGGSAATIEVMDRIVRVATKRPLGGVDTSWVDYWRTRSVAERLAMATELSLECVGEHPDQGLRRVHRVLRRP
jgi:hypothetical protein